MCQRTELPPHLPHRILLLAVLFHLPGGTPVPGADRLLTIYGLRPYLQFTCIIADFLALLMRKLPYSCFFPEVEALATEYVRGLRDFVRSTLGNLDPSQLSWNGNLLLSQQLQMVPYCEIPLVFLLVIHGAVQCFCFLSRL